MNAKMRLSTTPNIVGYGCYTLRPFAQPVACCGVLLGVVAQGFKLILVVTYHHLNKCVSSSR